ncbi:MAG: methyltransferase [Archangium sp.]
MTPAEVEPLLQSLFIDAAGTSLRDEDRKKAIEVAAFLTELKRIGAGGPLVDAAAGKSYLGLLAAELVGVDDVTVIERNEKQVLNARHALSKLKNAKVTLNVGNVEDLTCWPEKPRVVVGLHACGLASDAVIDVTIAREAKWLLLVPCCYPSPNFAHRSADELGISRATEVRKKFVQSLIDTERTLRLEAAGYETSVIPFVAPTVTPHNLMIRARRLMNEKRMNDAKTTLTNSFAWSSASRA